MDAVVQGNELFVQLYFSCPDENCSGRRQCEEQRIKCCSADCLMLNCIMLLLSPSNSGGRRKDLEPFFPSLPPPPTQHQCLLGLAAGFRRKLDLTLVYSSPCSALSLHSPFGCSIILIQTFSITAAYTYLHSPAGSTRQAGCSPGSPQSRGTPARLGRPLCSGGARSGVAAEAEMLRLSRTLIPGGCQQGRAAAPRIVHWPFDNNRRAAQRPGAPSPSGWSSLPPASH